MLERLFPGTLTSVLTAGQQRGAAAPADPIAAMRAGMGATPMTTLKLADNLTMLSGPGGNVVVLNGPDGKFVVDSFVQTVWTKLKQTVDGMGNAPIKMLIDTHWPTSTRPGAAAS